MIYLDTHVVIWLYIGEINRLSEKAVKMINKHEIIISPIVGLELQYLFEIQRITDESKEIIFDLSDRIGLKVCDKNFNVIINESLDKVWTHDPFDRIIVANASLNHDFLVTKDQTILNNYEGAIW